MTEPWIENFAQRLLQAGIATADTLKGCSGAEIADIEATFKVRLPRTYVDYLKRMGKEAGEFIGECSRTVDGFAENRYTADLLLKEVNLKLPETAFVFVESYGCQFFFFDTADGKDDPPVYRYSEGERKPVKISDTFTRALEMALEDQLMDRNPDTSVDRPYQFSV